MLIPHFFPLRRGLRGIKAMTSAASLRTLGLGLRISLAAREALAGAGLLGLVTMSVPTIWCWPSSEASLAAQARLLRDVQKIFSVVLFHMHRCLCLDTIGRALARMTQDEVERIQL